MRSAVHHAIPTAAREPVATTASARPAAALADRRPATDRLIQDSPRLTAQRRQIDTLFGPAVQRKAATQAQALQLKARPATARVSEPAPWSTGDTPVQRIATTVRSTNDWRQPAVTDYQPTTTGITEVIVRRQHNNDPHGDHWWMFFNVGGERWMQVDLIQADGYRTILTVAYSQERKTFTYSDQHYRGEGLTEADIFNAVADEKRQSDEQGREWRNNKDNQDGKNYNCRDFVDNIIGHLGLTAQSEPIRIEV